MRRLLVATLVVCFSCIVFSSSADARPRGYKKHYVAKAKHVKARKHVRVVRHYRPRRVVYRPRYTAGTYQAATVVGSRPAGCPRQYCGCGTALYLKVANRGGRLNLAANWLAFPRAAPGPGMAAARRGHVFAIIKVLGPGKVLAYDPNSGGGRTRIHVRSLSGYAVVNPGGHSRYAATNIWHLSPE